MNSSGGPVQPDGPAGNATGANDTVFIVYVSGGRLVDVVGPRSHEIGLPVYDNRGAWYWFRYDGPYVAHIKGGRLMPGGAGRTAGCPGTGANMSGALVTATTGAGTIGAAVGGAGFLQHVSRLRPLPQQFLPLVDFPRMQHEAQVNSFGSKHATFLAHVSEVVGATTGVVTGGVTTGVVTGGVTTGVVTGGVTTGAAMPVGGKHGDVTHFVRVAPSEGPAVIIELHA